MKESGPEVIFTIRFLRKITNRLANVVFPVRQVGGAEHVAVAESLLENGQGLIVLFNHFSLRDSFQIIAWLFGNKTFRRRPFSAPVAYHQHNALVQFLADKLSVTLCPIVTSKTVRIRDGEDSRGVGIRDYLDTAVNTLSDGGIILLAPQGGRRSRLGKPSGHPVGRIVKAAERMGVKNYGLLCIGLSIPGVEDYSRKKIGNLNLLRRYDILVGPPRSIQSAVHLVGGADLVDAWIFDKLSELVSSHYIGQQDGQPVTGIENIYASNHRNPQPHR